MGKCVLIGNVANPELRFTQSGKAVGTFSVAENKRKRDGDKWVDGPTSWTRVAVWGDYGENVIAALTEVSKPRVIVWGELRQRTWETEDGQKRSVHEVVADEVGLTMRFGYPSDWESTFTPKQRGDVPPPEAYEEPFDPDGVEPF